MKNKLILFTFIIALFSCKLSTKEDTQKISTIVCTTGMIGDVVKNIVGDQIKVVTLMGPGVDPHLYKATQGDLKLLNEADVIVYNGLHLEGKMGEIFEKLEKQKNIIVATDAIPKADLINNTEFKGAYDPHIWFDVTLWNTSTNYISKKLCELVSDSIAQKFKSNTQQYTERLISLNDAIIANFNNIDAERKVLITAHDAFGYFGRAYGFEVRGLQGISTTSEYGLKDVSDLVNFIIEREIKAVFVETSVASKSLEAIVEGCMEKGHEVKIGGKLYSDAMGKEGTPDGTYIGMVKHNVKTILKGI